MGIYDNTYLDGDGVSHLLTKMKRISVSIPTTSTTTFTYDGTQKQPTFTNVDTDKVSISYPTSINAGNYAAKLKLKDSHTYIWSDGTNADKEIAYTIDKAAGTMTVVSDTISLTPSTPSVDIVLSNVCGITDVVSDTVVFDADRIDNELVRLTGNGYGNDTFTIVDNGDNNHLSKTITVTVTSTAYKLVSWSNGTDFEVASLIQAADEGLVDLKTDAGWKVGDARIVHINEIPASGTYNGITWNNANTPFPEQDIKLVLIHDGDDLSSFTYSYKLNTSVKYKGGATRERPSFIVGVSSFIDNYGSIPNAGNTRRGVKVDTLGVTGHGPKWCDGAFYSALPSNLRPIFKKMSYITGRQGMGNFIFSLPSIGEIGWFVPNTTIIQDVDDPATESVKEFEWYSASSNKYLGLLAAPAYTGLATRSVSKSRPGANMLIVFKNGAGGCQPSEMLVSDTPHAYDMPVVISAI